MAAARLSAYLRTIKTFSEEQYGHIREVVTDKLPLDGNLSEKTADIKRSLFYSRQFTVRSQTLCRLILLSCAVCGIELCYAAETAFVSPTLLRLGIPTAYATLTWCLSPLLGLILGPVLGSLSDRCQSSLGRRRPFILLLSVGIIIGLVLVPHGQQIGVLLGDNNEQETWSLGGSDANSTSNATSPATGLYEHTTSSANTAADQTLKTEFQTFSSFGQSPSSQRTAVRGSTASDSDRAKCVNATEQLTSTCLLNHRKNLSRQTGKSHRLSRRTRRPHKWAATTTAGVVTRANEASTGPWRPTIGVLMTVIGVVLLDCCCDACQSPCRTYLLDVSKPENHAAGLTTFTVMAGLGGSVGYLLGGVVDWKSTELGEALGGHIQVIDIFQIYGMVQRFSFCGDVINSQLGRAKGCLRNVSK
jgi:hypothetical protein